MWPWGHLAVAYLLYSLYSHGRYRRPPRPEPAVAVLAGSQLADVIDKPLAWWVGILPSGRSLAHSLVFALTLALVVYTIAFAIGRVETATAFLIAHVSHLLADLPPRLFLGYPFGSEFLFWPFIPRGTFAYHERVFEPPVLVELIVTPFTDSSVFATFQVLLFGLALWVWYRDGCPGVQYVRDLWARYVSR